MIPASNTSLNSNPPSTLTNEEYQGLNILASLTTTIIQSTPTPKTPPLLASKKWESPLSKKGILKREAVTLTSSVAKKRLGFQQTTITSLATTLSLSISAPAQQMIEGLLGKIENYLISHDFFGTSQPLSQNDVKNVLYSILHNPKISTDSKICEITLFLYYLMRDNQIPSTTTSFFNKRLVEIREELDNLDRAFHPSLKLCSSGKIDYILNVFVRHLVFANGEWNRAGCIVVSHLSDEPCVKRLFSYEYVKRLQTTINHLFSDTTLSKEIEKYKDQKVHPSLEWIVRCDLKLHHQVDLQFYHAVCASLKMLLTDLRQAVGEENCFSVAPLIVVCSQNPRIPLLQSLTYLFEGDYHLGKLKFPLVKLIEGFFHEELIAKEVDRKELEVSTHLLTVFSALGRDVTSLPQQDSLSFSSLTNNNNQNSPDLEILRFASSLKYNYLQTLVLKAAIFSEINNLIESTNHPYFEKTKVSVLRNKRRSKTQEKVEYQEGRLVFFDPLFNLIKEEVTATISPNDHVLINSYFESWKNLVLEYLYFFPLRKKMQIESDGTQKCVIVQENGSDFIEPPENHPLIFRTMDGLAIVKDQKIEFIYNFTELQQIFLLLSQEALQSGFEKNRKISRFQKQFITYLLSDRFIIHLFTNLNNFHENTDYILASDEVERDLPLFFSTGGSGIRIFSDFFKQKQHSLAIDPQQKDVSNFLTYLHDKVTTFFKQKNLDFNSYHTLLAECSNHVFTLSPHSFSNILQLSPQELTPWINQKVLEKGRKQLQSIISPQVAEFLLEEVFPKEDSQKLLSIYFKKNQTFHDFCTNLKKKLSQKKQLILNKWVRYYFASVELSPKTITDLIKLLPAQIQNHPLVTADKVFDYIQSYYKKKRIEPFALARLLREAFLDLEVNSLSPYLFEEIIAFLFNLPLTIEIADLNYQKFGSSKETPEHIRLCIEYDYLENTLTFVHRELYETILYSEQEKEEIIQDFALHHCII